jgi:flagellar hook-basal body complex protein FliE
MSDAITSILSQIRSYQSQATGVGKSVESSGARAPIGANASGFAQALEQAVGTVNQAQREAGQLTRSFELGDPKIDLARVMIQSQEAQIGFKALVEVRNRLVQAYQDVMSMPL